LKSVATIFFLIR